MFKEPYYQRTISELKSARRNNLFAGFIYAAMSMFFFMVALFGYLQDGLVGWTVIFCSIGIVELLVVLDCGNSISWINYYIYVKSKELNYVE